MTEQITEQKYNFINEYDVRLSQKGGHVNIIFSSNDRENLIAIPLDKISKAISKEFTPEEREQVNESH